MESIFSTYIYRRYRKWASDNRIRGFRPMHPVQRLHHHRPSNHVGSLFRWYPDKIWQEAPFLLSKASSTPYQPRSLITNRWQIDFIQVRNLRFRRNHEWSTLGIKINKTTTFCTFSRFLRNKTTHIKKLLHIFAASKTANSAIFVYNIRLQRSRKNNSFLHYFTRNAKM